MINFYESKLVKKHITKLPQPSYDKTNISHSSTILVAGQTGAGKTHWLCNFINRQSNTFSKVIVCNKAEEPLYDYLKSELKGSIEFYKTLQSLPQPNELDDNESYLIVFDDMVTNKNAHIIDEYFIRGRKLKNGATIVFLTQSYFQTNKIIRDNIHYLILLKIAGIKDIRRILAEISLGISPEELLGIYNNCIKKKFDFMKIDIATADMNRKLSHNWTDYIKLEP